MDTRFLASLSLPSQTSKPLPPPDFASRFTHLTTALTTPTNPISKPKSLSQRKPPKSPLNYANSTTYLSFASTSLKLISPKPQKTLLKSLSVLKRALIGTASGGIAGAFTYVCLHPLNTIKTKLQTKGTSQIYANTFEAIIKTFQTKGILSFYNSVSVVIVDSTASSVVYFGTCELGKLVLGGFDRYPSILIPLTTGAMGK